MQVKIPVYLTIFPDLSVRSRTPTLLTTTLSAWWKATLHCSQRWTLLGHSFPSSLLTSSYWFPDILSGSRKFIAPVAAVVLFSTYEVKLYVMNNKPKPQSAYLSVSVGEKSYLSRNPREDLIIMLIFSASRSQDCELLAIWYELNTGILHLCDTLDPTKVYVGLSVRTINPVHLVPTFIDINKCRQSSSHLLLCLVITLWESNRDDCLRFVIANFNSVGEDFGFGVEDQWVNEDELLVSKPKRSL